jgi:hypothetical protein
MTINKSWFFVVSKADVEMNLTKEQAEAISEELARFFYDYWKNKSGKNLTVNKSNGKAIVSEVGLLRNFPNQTEAMT